MSGEKEYANGYLDEHRKTRKIDCRTYARRNLRTGPRESMLCLTLLATTATINLSRRLGLARWNCTPRRNESQATAHPDVLSQTYDITQGRFLTREESRLRRFLTLPTFWIPDNMRRLSPANAGMFSYHPPSVPTSSSYRQITLFKGRHYIDRTEEDSLT